ncbi:MAG: glycosyltransferase family 4 protein [Candidatus Omnitrophica bacterium]|nr:glycosyltransferase family 4 protein [Candidatus Omnitrophota bacterium]
MRIGIDCRAFQHPSRYQGIGTYSSNLIQALGEVNVCHEMIPFTYFNKQSLSRQLNAHRLDLCHILEFIPPFAPADRAVVTVYDLIPLIFPEVYLPWRKLRSCWYFRTYYQFLRKARQIVAISHQTRVDLIRLLEIPSSRIAVVYPGIGPAFRPLDDREKVTEVVGRHRIRTPFFLYVGSCDYRKNIQRLLAAFAEFRRDLRREFHLVLVGKDVERKRRWLRQLGDALGLGPFLRLIGYLPLEDLVALYNAASGFVYPSLYEGFGFPPLEAMACGTPVVTSNGSSLREVAEGCALLVDPRDTGALAEAMRRLVLDDGLRRRLVGKGMDNASRFTWPRAAREMVSLYEQIGYSFVGVKADA